MVGDEMIKNLLANKRGSFTIEAIIIMSTIILVLFLLCFSFMMMYQKMLITKTASFVAQEAADSWPQGNGLYYRISDGSVSSSKSIKGSVSAEKINEILPNKEKSCNTGKVERAQKNAFAQLFKRMGEVEETNVEIAYNNGFILREVKVHITQEIKIPLGHLKKFFDGKSTVTLEAESIAIVTDPAEYIRDVDLAMECAVKIKEKVDFDQLLNKVKGKAEKK